jgi:hypothetical protein
MIRSSKPLILSLCVIAMLLAFISYLYVTALGIVRLRPRMLYVEKCEGDSLKAEIFSLPFDGRDGNLTPDASGNRHAGIMGSLFDDNRLFFKLPQKTRNFAVPSPVEGANGMGKALRFNGRNWVHAGNSQCYTKDRFTISLWAWKDKARPIAEGDWFVPTLAAKSDWPGNGWWLCTEPNTNNIDMALSFGAARRHIHSGYALPPEEWHHISVTMDNITHEIGFFIDGKPFGEKHADVPAWLTNWDQNLFVGDYDGTARWPWFGRIDNVHFHGIVLSPEEIHAIYVREGGKP